MPSGAIITAPELDPTCTEPFKQHFEDDLVSASAVRGKLCMSCRVVLKVKFLWYGQILHSLSCITTNLVLLSDGFDFLFLVFAE